QRRLGRVEVLGLALAHHPAAEGDGAAAAVVDGEHHPAAEAVVRLAAALLRLDDQARLDQLVDRGALALQRTEKAVARIGGEAHAEVVDHLVAEAAAAQVIEAVPADRQAQLLLEPARRLLDHFLQGRGAFGPLALLWRGPRHRQADLAGQLLDRFGEGETLGLHHEADRVAVFAAAEAVEEAFLVADGERRRLLIMERAQSGKLGGVLALERDLAADDVAQADARTQLIEEARGEGHALDGADDAYASSANKPTRVEAGDDRPSRPGGEILTVIVRP